MNLNTYTILLVLLFSFQNSFAQCVPSCNNAVQISLDASGSAVVDPITVLEGNLNSSCLNSLSELRLEIDGINSITGNYQGITTTSVVLNCGLEGQLIPYTLKYIFADGSENYCWGDILVEDKISPTISCADLEINCNDPNSPNLLVQIYPNAQPVVNDNCNLLSLIHSDEYENYGCSNPNYLGKITRTWIGTDNSGNTSICLQNILIRKVNLSNIVFPDNLDDLSLPALECPTTDVSPQITGYPTLNGQSVENSNSCQLSINYTDQTLETCGNGLKIIRSWMVMDNCTNQLLNHLQIIKILDKTPPSISCSEISPIGTTSIACVGNVFIPEANIMDGCSDFSVVTQTPNGILNGNGGMISNLPLGTHNITYTATDDCGNSSTCSTTITVIDNIAPIVICDEHTKVSLTNDGTALVDALTFDDGSYDNCEIASYKVRRMATNCSPQTAFADQVVFDCCDVNNGYITVELQITDNAGNSNSCMVEVDAEDKLKPIITCPSNKTIECTQNLYNFGLLGQPVASDNCLGVTVQRVDNTNLNDCGIGNVIRTWTAFDVHGNSSSCVQTITVINSYPFDENDIIFPFDLTTSDCGVSGLLPDDLNYPYATPSFNQDACDQVAFNYEDTHLPISGPACFQILREWTVIDWCQYDPNATPNANGVIPGKWTHTQVIKVIDYSPPVFTTCPNNLVFENFESNCGNTFVELTTQAEDCSPNLTYTYEIDLYNDGNIDNVGSSNNASGSYPNGNHKIYFTVSDGCGNLGFCSFSFLIKDGKKPTPVCINGLAADLDNNGSLTIWASDFENGSSFDNCTDYQDLQFSFSSDVNQTSLIFDCSQIGNQIIDLWVTDEAGNQDYCSTYIYIQDNTGACPSVQLASIAGNIETENGIKLENTIINLQEDLNTTTLSNSNGDYVLTNLPQGYSYTVIPEKTTNPLNGVTTLDLVLIHKHILGLDPFDSPYQLIAADVNNSKTVTTMDVVQIRRLILSMDSEFQNNNSWKFIDANHVFSNNTNALNETFPETITIGNLIENSLANFIAIKVGDVNGTASPNGFTSGDTRNKTGNIFFQIKNKTFKKGDQIEVPIITNEFKNVIGYQFSLEFNANILNLAKVNPLLENSTIDNFNIKNADIGIITTSWHQARGSKKARTQAFSLIFNALEDGELVNNISINSSKTAAEAYYESGESIDVNLLFENTITQFHQNTFQLYQNKPNPVINQTKIGFNMPNNENVNFEIINSEGRIIKKINRNFPKGYNEIIFNKKDLNTSGVLFYSMELNGKRITKTMIISD